MSTDEMLTDEPPTGEALAPEATLDLLERVAARIAPTWPLADMVAVNPYLGLTDLPFADAVELLETVGGIRSTPSLAAARERLSRGDIDTAALADAVARHRPDLGGDTDAFLAELDGASTQPLAAVPLRCDLLEVGRADPATLMVERISAWASVWFDEGQSTWSSVERSGGLYRSWRAEAMIDRTPEVRGLRGLRASVASLPEDHLQAASTILAETGLPTPCLEHYLHALALRVGGWASVCARVQWDASRFGGDSDALVQFLVVLLGWDAAAAQVGDPVTGAERWRAGVRAAVEDRHEQVPHDIVLQDAADRSAQRRLVDQLRSAAPAPSSADDRSRATVVCCIDVRSEVLRRSLEATAPDVSTSGFAGFFGLAIEVRPVGHDRAVAQCPPLVAPAVALDERSGDEDRSRQVAETRRYVHHLHRAWKQFKTGAVSCFGFVSPLGLLFAPKLFSDAFGLTRPVRNPASEGLPPGAAAACTPAGPESLATIPVETRAEMAAGALRGMSMVESAASVVALVGHGSTSVNNPQSAALECGACGGHSGADNARIAVALLNDPEVRRGIRQRGVALDEDTLFVAALHDTTTDVVTVLDLDAVPAERLAEVRRLQEDLTRAGALARRERAPRSGLDASSDPLPDLLRRTRDWAQTRPEWGLAGCRAFVAAPRSRTSGVDLRGQVFLHEYEAGLDPSDAVLEQIMAAPMVVASWITLQYYASTVSPETYGSGDKTLHNVVGRMGVLEGSGGDVRIGLSRQSVHDGSRPQHDPLRLHAVIEASTGSIDGVISRNESVANLLDNGWVHLHAIDPDTQCWFRYDGSARWTLVE